MLPQHPFQFEPMGDANPDASLETRARQTQTQARSTPADGSTIGTVFKIALLGAGVWAAWRFFLSPAAASSVGSPKRRPAAKKAVSSLAEDEERESARKALGIPESRNKYVRGEPVWADDDVASSAERRDAGGSSIISDWQPASEAEMEEEHDAHRGFFFRGVSVVGVDGKTLSKILGKPRQAVTQGFWGETNWDVKSPSLGRFFSVGAHDGNRGQKSPQEWAIFGSTKALSKRLGSWIVREAKAIGKTDARLEVV